MLRPASWQYVVAFLIGSTLAFLIAWPLGWIPAPDQLRHSLDILNENAPAIGALATIAIAAFTWTLWRATDKLWQAGEKQIAVAQKTAEAATESADAAYLSAKAALRAEQAHVFPIIENENIVEMVQSWGRSGNPAREIKRIRVSYRLKNLGKTPAIIKVAGHELVHASSPPQTVGENVSFLEVVKILGLDDATDPPTDCTLQHLGAADARSILEGKTTIWFHGFITYDDVFGLERHLKFTWWYNGKLPRFGWYSFRGSESRKNV